MSLLRVCAFAKCLSRRSLFEKCPVRVSFADFYQLRVSAGNGAVRRISETPLQFQRTNLSFILPKKEDVKKRVVEQYQLLDVLEARIQQLQSDIVLDVQHAKVQFVKAPSNGRRGSAGKSPKSTPKGKTGIPKSGQTVAKAAPKSQTSRWMEKLIKEKKSKEQKIQKKLKEKNEAATRKTNSAAFSTVRATAAWAAAVPFKLSKNKGKDSESQVSGEEEKKVRVVPQEKPSEMNFQLDEELEKLKTRLNQESSHWMRSSNPEHLQDSEGNIDKDLQISIRCYLEACAFLGDLERANCFLLSQHRVRKRRKYLNTGIHNIVMKAWAKRGALHQVGRIFILLEEAGLKPNVESYSAALESMGRSPRCTAKVVSRCLNQMKSDGLSIDDLFSRCGFWRDERDMLLKAIRIVKPKYQPKHNMDMNQLHQPHSPLVQDFYKKGTDHTYPKLDFTQEELQERFKRQWRVEQACTVTINSVEAAKPVTENMVKMRQLLVEQQTQWEKILLKALRESKRILGSTNINDYKLNLHPYLCLLDDWEYVDMMIQSIATMPPRGEALVIIANNLGNRIYTKYSVRLRSHMEDKLGSIYNTYTALLAKDAERFYVLPREHWCSLEMEQNSGPTLQGPETSWPYSLTLELGTYLVDLMVKNLKINNDILNPTNDKKLMPMLYHMYIFRSTRQIGFVKPHPVLSQMQLEAGQTELTFDSYVMPMLCPPMPWTSIKFGAYLLTQTKLMRTGGGASQHDLLLEQCQNLHAVLDSLNQLGNCAWRINKPLLDIIISIFNDCGSEKLDIPPPMSEAPKIFHFNPQDLAYTSTERAEMKKEVMSAKKKHSEMHSLRMDALYKLSIAQHLRDEIFWFPHNMDFRGRTYPCPPYFNHLGSDVTRAILLFAEGKPLGPKGLDWLKIHLVNLTGLKKTSSIQERLEYANTIMADILDSADKPLNGEKWWMNADEPWQALACCMELADAVRSPDPTQFISHFPVHQDGSCNGLQHYAALGRDVIGATSVNLMPCDFPQDVYSGVAQQMEEFRALDAKNNLKIAQILEGFISRKVVKQTVMTVVYGVTRYGGRLQIEKRLKEIDEFPKAHVWEASQYLVRLVFTGLKEMFTGTRKIQDWLTESAKLISKSGHTVEWVTPLGLPVVQPYHRTRSQVVKGNIQQVNLQINHDISERPDTVKQKNAFPPNFIHSLDSTHMMLTSLHCHSAGLTFVSVHDCYWTHAITVDTMNKVCREQFVALHSQPILQELSNYMLHKYFAKLRTETRYKKYKEYRKLLLLLDKVPQTGDFDLQRVKESTYFFS